MSEPAVTETHISVLFFVGDRAYKLKKTVDLGFVDLTPREARERICHREVELNSRLSPDVYLGVLDISAEGEPVDHLVVMRRMPDDRRLSTLVTEGDTSVGEHLRALARLVADFHSRAERSKDIDRAATPEAILALWEESFAQMTPFEGDVLDAALCRRIEHLVRRYLEGRHELLARRISTGHICDGHGDLQAADVFCLDDGPRVLDCIEFNDRFRHGDVISDVAFLAMDLERLGAPDLARGFLDRYAEFAAETCPRSLVELYVAYRAHVRAKVNLLRAAQTTGDEHDEAVAEARRLMHTAHRWLEAGRVRLVLVGGTPGTGKSTLARGVGEALGWPVLSTDEIRLEGSRGAEEVGFGEGRYAPDAKARVYRELLDRASRALCGGESVVLDGTWVDHLHRDEARAVAAQAAADVVELRCVAPDDVALERIAQRLAAGGGTSEATPDVALGLAAGADPWPEATAVDTSGAVGESLIRALEVVAGSATVA